MCWRYLVCAAFSAAALWVTQRTEGLSQPGEAAILERRLTVWQSLAMVPVYGSCLPWAASRGETQDKTTTQAQPGSGDSLTSHRGWRRLGTADVNTCKDEYTFFLYRVFHIGQTVMFCSLKIGALVTFYAYQRLPDMVHWIKYYLIFFSVTTFLL